MRFFALAACMVLLSSSAVFARPSERDVRVLRQSAAVLVNDHPDLAKRLRRDADVEANENEREESAEQRSERREGHELTDVKEAADALQNTRPDLAKRLRRFAQEETARQKKGWTERSERHENERD